MKTDASSSRTPTFFSRSSLLPQAAQGSSRSARTGGALQKSGGKTGLETMLWNPPPEHIDLRSI
jgi:hypothetical protein